MPGVVPPQFRPTILICVGSEDALTAPGDPGFSVVAHLTDICSGLHPAQRNGIGIIGINEGERTARPISLHMRDDGTTYFPDGMPARPDDLPRLFEDMMRHVMNARLLKAIEGAGFPIPEPHAQILIVAHTHSTWISTVARWVGDVLAQERIATTLLYLLIDVPTYLGDSNGQLGGDTYPLNGNSFDGTVGIRGGILDSTTADSNAFPPDDMDASIGLSSLASSTGAGRDDGTHPGSAPDRRSPPIWAFDLISHDGELPLVNFGLVYQRLAQDDRYYDESDVRFSIAEAIFGLIATSTPAAESFSEVMRIGPNIHLGDADSRIGSLATSLIRFPRAEVERFCADMLGADLMREWEAMHGRGINESEREQQRRAAQRLGEHILAGVHDSEPRPGTEEYGEDYLWPTLEFMRERDQLGELRDRTQELFDNFGDEAVDELATGEDNWVTAIQQLEGRAAGILPAWKQTAEQVWGEARRQLEAEVDQAVLTLWLTDVKGIALAQEYIKRLDLALNRLDRYFVQWRRDHAQQYQARLEQLRTLSQDGPWYTPPSEANVVGGEGESFTQAIPRYIPEGTLPPSSADSPPDESDSSPNPSPPPSPVAVGTLDRMDPASTISNAYLPDDERQIAERLSERARQLRTQVPTVAHLIALGIFADPALILLALTLIPASWSHQPLAAATIALLMIAATSLVCWLVRDRALARYDDARQDILEINRLYYARQCQIWEDQLRAVLRGRISRNVRRMQDRLANMEAFIQRIQAELVATAEQTRDRLFNGPSGLRDVFVANGRHLSPYDYTLDDLYLEIRRRMRAAPDDPHTASPRDMIARLRESLVRDSVNFLRMTDTEIELRIRQFVRISIRHQLQGDLVSVVYALKGPGETGKLIWQTSLQSATTLYRPVTSAPILSYICGQDEQRATIPPQAIPPATTMIGASHDEWLAILRFWTGGARSQWNMLDMDDSPLRQRLRSMPTWHRR